MLVIFETVFTWNETIGNADSFLKLSNIQIEELNLLLPRLKLKWKNRLISR